MIIAGVVFWLAMAFLGSMRSYIQQEGRLYHFFYRIKSGSSLLLLVIVLTGLGLSALFCSKEIAAIQDHEGMIGLYFLLSVFFGLLGSTGLSALLFLDSD